MKKQEDHTIRTNKLRNSRNPFNHPKYPSFPRACEEEKKNQHKPTRKTPHDCLRQCIPPYLNKNKIANQLSLLALAQWRIKLLIPSLLSRPSDRMTEGKAILVLGHDVEITWGRRHVETLTSFGVSAVIFRVIIRFMLGSNV